LSNILSLRKNKINLRYQETIEGFSPLSKGEEKRELIFAPPRKGGEKRKMILANLVFIPQM